MLRTDNTEESAGDDTAEMEFLSDAFAIATDAAMPVSVFEDLPSPSTRRLARMPDPIKLFRYGATSLLALGISEVTLLALFANGVGATSAAFVANLAGTAPSYLLSRYWIWPGADRRRAGRQVLAYWIISVLSMTLSSFATGAVSAHTPRERVLHLTVLASAYLLISLALWIAKYLVYESAIFRPAVNEDVRTL
jgi:putative flippase GtrA